jgi:CubicO group peptidase (beta-lactamase class C family)
MESMRSSLLAGLLGGFAALSAAAAEPPCAAPAALDDGWEIATPAASGFDAEALCATLAGVSSGDANIHGVVIERHGRLVAELYRKGPDHPIDVLYGVWNPFAGDTDFGPTTQHDVRSISKSIVGLLIGIARQQGHLADLAAPAIGFFPALGALRSPQRDAISLESLLTMSSGLDWDEGALPNDETKLYWKPDLAAFVLGRPIVAAPGTTFHYDSGGTAVLADILVRESGKPLAELARSELFEPLGIRDWEWVTDLRGRPLAFTGLRMRPRDLAKIGRMTLDRGEWRGRPIVPAAWIAASLRPHLTTGLRSPPTARHDLGYGYQFWTGSVEWKERTLPWSAGFGNGGQRLFLLPELDVSVVVTSGDYGSPEINHIVNQLFSDLVATIADR